MSDKIYISNKLGKCQSERRISRLHNVFWCRIRRLVPFFIRIISIWTFCLIWETQCYDRRWIICLCNLAKRDPNRTPPLPLRSTSEEGSPTLSMREKRQKRENVDPIESRKILQNCIFLMIFWEVRHILLLELYFLAHYSSSETFPLKLSYQVMPKVVHFGVLLLPPWSRPGQVWYWLLKYLSLLLSWPEVSSLVSWQGLPPSFILSSSGLPSDLSPQRSSRYFLKLSIFLLTSFRAQTQNYLAYRLSLSLCHGLFLYSWSGRLCIFKGSRFCWPDLKNSIFRGWL